MITSLVILFVVLVMFCVLFGIGFAITGFILSALFWALVKLPLSLICFSLGLACCCTLILIPLGVGLFKVGARLLLPGKMVFA
ncbi:MAG: hypothetical protein MJ124_09620 [Lachnospiraceae bacterium]|nr:hypothetical protein [Lachnospiraceae bacterium]